MAPYSNILAWKISWREEPGGLQSMGHEDSDMTERLSIYICRSVTQSCPTLCDSMDCNTPGSLSFTISQSLLRLMSNELMMPFNHLVIYHPVLLLPSIFPIIRVFSNELARHIRWPKYWSFSFSFSPSNEYSGLISLRID